MVNSIYYYRYSKVNKTVNFVRSNITVEPTRKSEDNSLFYYKHDLTESFPNYLVQINSGKELISSDFKLQSEFVNGYSVQKAFSRNGQNSLFSKFLCDTIFNLTPNSVYPKYIINYPNRFHEISAFSSKEKVEKLFTETSSGSAQFMSDSFAETTNDFVFFTSVKGGVGLNFYNKKTKNHS